MPEKAKERIYGLLVNALSHQRRDAVEEDIRMAAEVLVLHIEVILDEEDSDA